MYTALGCWHDRTPNDYLDIRTARDRGWPGTRGDHSGAVEQYPFHRQNSQRLRPDFHFAVFRAGRAHRLHAPRECLPLRSGLSIDPLALFGMERAAPGTYPALGSLHARRKAISSNTAVGVFLSNQSRADDFAF